MVAMVALPAPVWGVALSKFTFNSCLARTPDPKLANHQLLNGM